MTRALFILFSKGLLFCNFFLIIIYAIDFFLYQGGVRRECCDVKPMRSMNMMEINVRSCGVNEALVWSHLA